MQFTAYLNDIKANLERGSERTHYYPLKTLIDSTMAGIQAIIEEKENQVGIPDFTVRKNGNLLGYIEAKKIGENLDKIENTEQLQRYLNSSIGANLILTNYTEFRWYVNGKLRLKSLLANINKRTIVPATDTNQTRELINSFLGHEGKIINNSSDLAKEMASYTRTICYAIREGLDLENGTGELSNLQKLFADLLLPDLTNDNFADMYAQTIAYGLFTARVNHSQSPKYAFERQTIGFYLTDNIPFLKSLFNIVINTQEVSKIDKVIDLFIELLAHVEMSNILENFGQVTQQEDVVVHFYETFLAYYSASLRKSRGVYYTPEPVVTFMVKAVDEILKNKFDLNLGIADKSVKILDPATGTGTFLYQVIKQIYGNIQTRELAQEWTNYVKESELLNRLYGFELLMTPYTIAHLKLGLLLKSLGYQLDSKERLGIYLTNALEKGIRKSELIIGKIISEEANKAVEIKEDIPILVVLGNPPYAGHSANKNDWIELLVKDYYQVDGLKLDEKNPKWLQDDYVKFIRFGQERINKTGYGILAFVTNHGYLDNPTFRGMRQSLMNTFDQIYILDLHGNSKKKESAPNGEADKNVFDIQQGVSIGIMIKSQHRVKSGIFHADLWGSREGKYAVLNESSFTDIEWKNVKPTTPFYLFIPQNTDLLEEYHKGWQIKDIFPVNSVGIVTARDSLTIQWNKEDMRKVIDDFVSLSEASARVTYNLGKDAQDWQVSLAQDDLRKSGLKDELIVPILYRPFDLRYTYYTGRSRGFICRTRNEVMRNMILGENLGIVCTRQQSIQGKWTLVGVTEQIIESSCISNKTAEINSVFPLYIYPNTQNQQTTLFLEKTPNLSPQFLEAIKAKLGNTPSPESIFYYIYAIFHCLTYRERYAEFLKIDFPRVPLTSNKILFKNLVRKGEELVNLHLMKSAKLESFITGYHSNGDNLVSQVKYDENKAQVAINKNSYFSGIAPEVWHFRIGAYQVLDKWLKDRKNAHRELSIEDIQHYQKIVIAVKETLIIMAEIDLIIGNFSSM